MLNPIMLACPGCGAMNRVPAEKFQQGAKAVCGRCRSPLVGGSKPVDVTDATFSSEVEQSPLPVLLDFWAPWCGPCRAVAPLLEQLASEMAGRLRVAKLNVDENPRTAVRFNVQSIPTLLLLRSGQEVERFVGVHSKADLARRVTQLLA